MYKYKMCAISDIIYHHIYLFLYNYLMSICGSPSIMIKVPHVVYLSVSLI